MARFDYIIVGTGSSGCVLANRLSADRANRVRLIEAGGENRSPFSTIAGGFMKIMRNPEYFWAFPHPVSANTNGPATAVAARAAELTIADVRDAPVSVPPTAALDPARYQPA
jgi:choline dehydrogenase-like flavoprotein